MIIQIIFDLFKVDKWFYEMMMASTNSLLTILIELIAR